MEVSLGFCQFDIHWGDKEKNFKKVEKIFDGLKKEDKSLKIIALPELFSTGYLFLDKKEISKLSEKVEGETYYFLRDLAENYNSIVAGGLLEKENNNFYNSALIVAPDGSYLLYRKIHLFKDEKDLFEKGDLKLNVFNYNNLKIGVLICFDYFFPEAARTLAIKGAEIICHPANLILPYAPLITQVRALENRIFWILANRIGIEKRGDKELKFLGKSQIISPKGEILIKAEDEETLKLVEVNINEAKDKKVTDKNDLLLDRRTEFYEI
ncbi:MAG: nitrilase-related carbon-nitrogen hydrolase [candidate division WOR-3 bacterium]